MNLLEGVKFSKSKKKDMLTKVHPSAVMDHVAQTNHAINWDSIELPMTEGA